MQPHCISVPGGMKCHSTPVSRTQARMAFCELRAVIGHDHARLAAALDDGAQLARGPATREQGVRVSAETLLSQ